MGQWSEHAEAVLWERSSRRVRTRFGGATVAESKRAMLLIEPGQVPAWYFPQADVRMDLLEPTATVTRCGRKGPARHCDVRVGDRVARDAAFTWVDPPLEAPVLPGSIAFVWDAMDAWYEEDEPVLGHPKDPRHRVDALLSSRAVVADVGGAIVARSRRPIMVFETGREPVAYIPLVDVEPGHLAPSGRQERCAYKGLAERLTVSGGGVVCDGAAWTWVSPSPELAKVHGYVAFDPGCVAVTVDGHRLSR